MLALIVFYYEVTVCCEDVYKKYLYRLNVVIFFF